MRPQTKQLISQGVLVCPSSKQRLQLADDGRSLLTADRKKTYPVIDGVPVLTDSYDEFRRQSGDMLRTDARKRSSVEGGGLIARLERYARRGYEGEDFHKAYESVFPSSDSGRTWVNIGGGQKRKSHQLNLNIVIFGSVDVIGDAQKLPFGDETVDAVCCEALLEHLPCPQEAVLEMRRILKPGGKVFASTPFMQNYHGYPGHYQNFTHQGHRLLFEAAGFRVLACGTGVGPVYTILTLNALFIKEFFPRPLSSWLSRLFRYATAPLRRLDRRLASHPSSYLLASTTYLTAVK
ncbi:MAG: methyltransferase domain-containing protein [Elusimicrobia bacterium]|nr:methyltransferase domain-containing protein [Elusimicrobiota bacterium]